MSLYFVTIGKKEYRVNIDGKQVAVDGRPVSGSLQALNSSGLHLLRCGMQSLELFLNSQDRDTLEILVGSRRVLARVETLQRQLSGRTPSIQIGCLVAPMPGLVVDVPVTEGQQVEQGQTLVVLESMKMQMQLRADRAGKVQTMTVQPGSQVEKGTLLVRIDSIN